MDHFSQSFDDQHLCYVRCNFCNTVLAVGVPQKRLTETVTVKCGHCSNLSLLGTKIPVQGQCFDHQISPHQVNLSYKGHIIGNNLSEMKKGNSSSSSSSSSSTSNRPLFPDAPVVAKPPEKKHRLPSAYNLYMKEEIQRLKAANPDILHKDAFSAAAKNWSRHIPGSPGRPVSDYTNNV